MFESELLVVALVVIVLQLFGVDVVGMAGDWLTSQLGSSIIPW